MLRAVDDYRNGRLNLREAAEVYEVPRSTISDYKIGKFCSNKIGRKTKLGVEIERVLVQTCTRLSDIGLGLTKLDVLAVVKSYCKKTNQLELFPPEGPSDKFYSGFFSLFLSIDSCLTGIRNTRYLFFIFECLSYIYFL